jgi:hypothetical protein
VPEPFEPLRETLLRAGVAPAHVRRYLRELSEHFSDLVGEELKAGRSPDEARAAARGRLGGDEALAGAMLAEPSLRSWTARAPWATLFAAPIVLLLLAWLLPMMGLARLGRHPGVDGPLPPPPWLPQVGDGVMGLLQVAAPLLITAGAAFLCARQRSRLIWPVLGCLAVAYFGGGLVWSARWPTVGALGVFVVRFRWDHSLIVGSLCFAVAVALYGKTVGWRPAAA